MINSNNAYKWYVFVTTEITKEYKTVKDAQENHGKGGWDKMLSKSQYLEPDAWQDIIDWEALSKKISEKEKQEKIECSNEDKTAPFIPQ